MAKRRSRSRNAPMRDADSQWLRVARTLWSTGRHDEALRQFDEAVRNEPRNVRALRDAATAHAMRYRFERTEALLGQLRKLAVNQPGVHHMAGQIYSWLQLPVKATKCFERATSLQGALPSTWVELASLYERSHRLPESTELLNRALHVQPDSPKALLVRARVERREKQYDQAEATLRTLLGKLPAGSELACQAWADLAAIKDACEEFDEAIKAIERCKQMQLARDANEWKASEHVLGRFQRFIDTVTGDDLERWHREGQAMEGETGGCRTALLSGFPRSGTTLIEQVLDAHPDLVSSEERDYLAKELIPTLGRGMPADAPVQDVLDSASSDQLEHQRRRYLQAMEYLLGEPIGGRLHLDKNPAYNPIIPVVLRLFPNTRLIVSLRDPRDVVLSCYLRHLPLNPVSVRFLTLQRTAARYTLDMRAWLKFRDLVRVPWCEVRYEDAVEDLERETRRMLEMLGLPWRPEVMEYRQRFKERRVNSPSYEAVTRPVYRSSVGRWKNYEKHLEPIFDQLEPFLSEFGYA